MSDSEAYSLAMYIGGMQLMQSNYFCVVCQHSPEEFIKTLVDGVGYVPVCATHLAYLREITTKCVRAGRKKEKQI